ncbi:carbamoyl-phosphate synthase L chain, ATP binding domain-containing protein [Aspergillus pseudodeflectus]|uniref:Carbamoyl-phosphate synthase L chain, ATP binding domain-containing protein n=1 Tax=Aspergillus pseudodeflectus TaxID=176178 RepID=A0ABR4KHG8_9EURO
MTVARSIQRLLVANRGEIAVRILQATRETFPSIETFALYTEDDRSHCDIGRPHRALQITSDGYLDIDLLVRLAQQHAIDAIHPGYGFLSESAEFSKRMQDVGVTVIGPGWEVLNRTGDKLKAKQLAQENHVPVLPALDASTDVQRIKEFAHAVGYPIMIKAVDGGGGRGIRLVRGDDELESAARASTAESPTKTVFVEKAAVNGFHHVEIQIVGDGTDVQHLWERDCSIQRRFQKVVEFAPSSIRSDNEGLVSEVTNAAVRMMKAIRYQSLGTVEFLVNEQLGEFYFLEINPRIQVEHTITEAITGLDLVQIQLLIAQGYSLAEVGLGTEPHAQGHSIQLRLCSEDPRTNFSLSVGKVTEFSVPTGNGVRVDTHVDMAGLSPVVVGAQFDNLLAKIIVTGSSTWKATVLKARRVLADTRISGVKTNLDLLRGILDHEDFLAGKIDTQWLEKHIDQAVQLGGEISKSLQVPSQIPRPVSSHSLPSSNILFRPGDSWSITLEPLKGQGNQTQQQKHHLQLTRVLQNDFPSSMSAEVKYTTAASESAFRLQLESTNTTAAALVSSHRRGDPRNPRHVVLPISGKLIEVLVAPGDMVEENQVVAFVKQMKMELEVRSPRTGRAQWVYEMEEEEDVADGILLVELEEELRGKL